MPRHRTNRSTAAPATAPTGGLTGGKQLRRWRWTEGPGRLSAPLRCKAEQWYLVRARLANPGDRTRGALLVQFLDDDTVVRSGYVHLRALPGDRQHEALLGWVQCPEEGRLLQVALPDGPDATAFADVRFEPIADRDPKCHPLAGLQRWSSYQPPFPIERIVLPESLAGLAESLACDAVEIETLKRPRSWKAVARQALGAACVLDPAWVREFDLTLAKLEQLAEASWLVIDLETLAAVAKRAKVADARLKTWTEHDEIMSAKNVYADVPTRGLALFDIVPYAWRTDNGEFATRVITGNRSWRRYADDAGFAMLLASETPWEDRSGDLLCASLPKRTGELLASDLPWLVNGDFGRLLAPRLAGRMLRAQLGLPIDDWLQYWNRWDDTRIVLRDIADLQKRFPPLTAVRWAAGDRNVAVLGVSLPPPTAARRHLMIRTGRIDYAERHCGVPPEPMTIFMKMLAREARERTAFARKHLADTLVTWQFDSAEGLRYTLNFASAETLPDAPLPLACQVVHVPSPAAPTNPNPEVESRVIELTTDPGVFGDGSLDFQQELNRKLLRFLESPQ